MHGMNRSKVKLSLIPPITPVPGGAGCVGRLAGAWEDDAAGVDEAARAEREKKAGESS